MRIVTTIASASTGLLTVQTTCIARWEHNGRILGIAVSAVSSDCIGQRSSSEAESAVVIEQDFGAVGHDDERVSWSRSEGKEPYYMVGKSPRI